jgi:hypothetical protein
MEKTIVIGDKKLLMKASAKNLLVYHSQFGEDFFSAAGSLVHVGMDGTVDFRKISSLDVARLAWCMAKTADGALLPFEEWFAELDTFPVLDVYTEIIELIVVNMTTKNARAAKAEK